LKEKSFLREIFNSDAKNYHAWSYRIWLVERFQLWAGELEDVERMLDDDVCNNSVWSYRYFLLNRSPVGTFNSL
jgi:protein farnesyltransferase/geranylgeranyltransferase type-1 subunit alpha